MLKKKIEIASEFIEQNQPVFRCPLCHENIVKMEQHTLICKNAHHFDLSKKGYMYFLTKSLKSDYDTELFEHRRQMIQQGMYDEMLKQVSLYLDHQDYLVDAGCGDGSFLSRLHSMGVKGKKIGFDIAKEGVQMATNQKAPAFWCVADMTNLPFANQSIDTVLCILSPSHYQEFHRVLKPTGKLVKIIPGEHYLKELREVFYPKEKQAYSNKVVIDKFVESMKNVKRKHVIYTFPITQENYWHLVKMSPLTWHFSEAELQDKVSIFPKEITIDLEILIGN